MFDFTSFNPAGQENSTEPSPSFLDSSQYTWSETSAVETFMESNGNRRREAKVIMLHQGIAEEAGTATSERHTLPDDSGVFCGSAKREQ
jgi:hypothetical protein